MQVVDGEAMPHTLFQLVKQTLVNKDNSVIAFHDNSSVIKGHAVTTIVPDSSAAGGGGDDAAGGRGAARFVEVTPTLHHLLTYVKNKKRRKSCLCSSPQWHLAPRD